MTWHPMEFKDDKDPMVVMKWIAEIEHVFYTCKCEDRLKVGFATYMLKDHALGLWNNLHKAVGTKGITSLTWEEFLKRIKTKFSLTRRKDKLANEFFVL